jgi:DeoR/GlpR family transcriptional regulator of sugar metabolism
MKSLRQKNIVAILEEKGIIATAELAKQFGVSIETIRRDLDQLEKKDILRKNYGGAEIKAKPIGGPLPLESRRAAFHDVKAAIASRAAEYVTNNCTVALDAGTTVFELCKFLGKKQNLVVISSDIHSAAELLSSGNNKIYMMGGFLTVDGTSSGTFVKEFLNNIAGIDVFVFSTDGASLEDGLSTDEASINDVKKLYIKKAKKRIAMVDHSKFSKRAFYKMCDFIDIDVLITDPETPSDIIQKIRRLGTQVDVVEI